MTSSELRYLIAASELAEQIGDVKQTDVANKLRVTKVSTYNAIERLREKGMIKKNERKIVLTEKGEQVLSEYMTIIRFISMHLSFHCGTPESQAYEDALNAACAFSETTRNGVAEFIRSGMNGARPQASAVSRPQANPTAQTGNPNMSDGVFKRQA